MSADRGHHHSSSGSGALSFLPNLFGRRPTTSRPSRRGSNEPASPHSRLRPLPPDSKRAPSPAPFDLHSSIDLMEARDELSPESLCEMLKATAVYLANLVIDHQDISVSSTDITRLYRIAIRFARPSSSRMVRIASKRLLAALITISPPGGSGIVAVSLPTPITTATLYRVIVSKSPSVDEAYVEIGALNALTKNGVEVDATEGIVGWLCKTLDVLVESHVRWCETGLDDDDERKTTTPFAPIKPATSAEAICAAIDLVAAIVASHACLFSYTDLRLICRPMFTVFWRGALAELREGVREPHPHSIPSLALGIEPALRRSVSLKRSRADSASTGTPLSPEINPLQSRRPKWSRPMISFSAFFAALTKSVAIPTDVFREAVAVACLVQGQDPEDGAYESDHAADLLTLVLGPTAGRRGESAIRMILDGTAAKTMEITALSDLAIDRCTTRGAVIACHTLLDLGPEHTTSSMADISPSLVAAQSTNRLRKAADWELVDTAILGLLQSHVLRSTSWAEGQAVCDIMASFAPIICSSPRFNLRELRSADYAEWLDKTGQPTLLPLFESVLHQLEKFGEHPRRMELLLSLGSQLDAQDADILLDYYERECLCLPFTAGWTANIWRLLRAFVLVPNPVRDLRVCRLVLKDVYAFASDSPESRLELVDQVILPFLSQHLVKLQPEQQRDALSLLVREAVTETFERDEERRQVRATLATDEIAEEDASPEASQAVTEATFSGSFNTIRALIAELAHLPCEESDHRRAPHAHCRSQSAATSLIAIFTRLCFTPSHYTQASVAIRMPASFRSIIIFRDLLGLLYPMTDDRPRHIHTPNQVKIAARCPRARLIILDWLMRLRADQHHRVFVKQNVEDVLPFAAMLKRAADDDERGRGLGQGNDARSRSRSKASGPTTEQTPLWHAPQEPAYEIPHGERSSEVMTTYDPFHPALKNPEAPPVDGVWLPVSQYVRVLNGILRGHDWELVSFVLCFLPLQLRNKLFFHGKRAVKEVQALLQVLVDGVMGRGNWDRRYNVPAHIKRVDINAIAYQSLSILVAYRGTLRRDECDALVQAFAEGLQGRKELAKPCLQALTVCIFELEQYVARHLLNIIERMERIVSTTALAVHILEFLIALGQNGSLYRNFTDEQYRRVFHVAIDYITIHNARSDEPVDLEGLREEYTLSQHVIGLAYHSIYLWFLALKLSQRPNLVPEITRKLLQGRSKRVIVDEMAEVCFDWLARYTYGSADPRPATSFLTEIVMSEERENEALKSLSWLLGGAIVTVTAQARTGWATITTTRPTGSTSVVCKLENVPLLDIGESNADMTSLPAFLMANRHLIDDKPPPLAEQSVSAPQFESAQHGYIWSGATPSQRRKDVVINPSFVALQLLSSYPNQSLETPRGRLIPPEERYQRALRGIQNTLVIDTIKIGVLYAAPGQHGEQDILNNIDGSPLYLDFLTGLGRLIKLKGQVDVFVGGLNRDNDSDGEYAYAWWDDFVQVIFHTATMMPNNGDNKKRLIGNDFVKIVYNESGKAFEFDTIRTAWNFINVVISPLTLGEGTILPEQHVAPEDGWADWDREEWFKVEVQCAPGIPEFGPFGQGRLVSRHSLPILVRLIVIMANDLSARFMHIRDARDAQSAEYITSWRSRLRALGRLRDMMPKFDLPDAGDETAREELKRDFTRQFTYR